MFTSVRHSVTKFRALGAFIGAAGVNTTLNENQDRAAAPPLERRPGARRVPGEPIYSIEQVSKADGVDGRPFWVTYRNGVYDITDFLEVHPGGGLIMQAAGADVGTFWDIWAHHHHAPKVGEWLEKLRIGTLKEDTDNGNGDYDPYEDEPIRDRSVQRIFTERPYCSETPNSELINSYLTSAEALYVRNHAPVPNSAFSPEGTGRAYHAKQHEIIFEIMNSTTANSFSPTSSLKSITKSIAELRKEFGITTITSVLQCAGNRASEDITATGPNGFSGSPYEKITQGMVGNAQWSGIRLSDILPCLFPDVCNEVKRHGGGEWHVVFEGADGYSASSPLTRVLDSKNDCILATDMNGMSLSPDHGYPVRAVLPGVAGARNVKWIQSISVQRKPVDAPWNEYYYKNSRAEQIQTLPLQSLILSHEVKKMKDTASNECMGIEIKGVAYSGGTGNAIAKVEVSADGGKTWSNASLKTHEVLKDGSQKNFGWVRWSAELETKTEGGTGMAKTMTICCRATDSEGNSQMEVSDKQRGYLYNGWSKVNVTL
jgi:sulfite oxidase